MFFFFMYQLDAENNGASECVGAPRQKEPKPLHHSLEEGCLAVLHSDLGMLCEQEIKLWGSYPLDF